MHFPSFTVILVRCYNYKTARNTIPGISLDGRLLPPLLFVFRYWAKSSKSAHITHVTDGRGGGGEWGINSGFITGIVTRKHPLRIQSRLPPLNRGLGCVSQLVLLRYLVLCHLWLHQMPRAPWTPCLCSTRVDSENQIRTMSVSRIDLQFACHRLLPPSHLGW